MSHAQNSFSEEFPGIVRDPYQRVTMPTIVLARIPQGPIVMSLGSASLPIEGPGCSLESGAFEPGFFFTILAGMYVHVHMYIYI